MGEKKVIEISLGTVICMIIIVVLLIALVGIHIYYESIYKSYKNADNIEMGKTENNIEMGKIENNIEMGKIENNLEFKNVTSNSELTNANIAKPTETDDDTKILNITENSTQEEIRQYVYKEIKEDLNKREKNDIIIDDISKLKVTVDFENDQYPISYNISGKGIDTNTKKYELGNFSGFLQKNEAGIYKLVCFEGTLVTY